MGVLPEFDVLIIRFNGKLTFKDDGAVLIPTNFIPAISISPKREATTTIQAHLAGYRTGIRMLKKR